MPTIFAKVGDWKKGAMNRRDDVVVVQTLLKSAAAEEQRPEFDPGEPDGAISRHGSSRTVKAICAFQSSFMRRPDGIVSPGMGTMQRLNAFDDDLLGYFMNPGKAMQRVGASVVTIANKVAALHGPCFPLARVPRAGYHRGDGRRWFGAMRERFNDKTGEFRGYQLHGACDLIAPEGTPIYAVDDGVVARGVGREFFRGTFDMVVEHPNFLVRYCEVKGAATGVSTGSEVRKGDVIAYVGKMWKDSMLHFEMYANTMSGRLSVKQKLPKTPENVPFCRRADLIDPTPYLDKWQLNMPTPTR